MKKSELRKLIKETIKEQWGDDIWDTLNPDPDSDSVCWDPCATNGVAPGSGAPVPDGSSNPAGGGLTQTADCAGNQFQAGEISQTLSGMPVMQTINAIFQSGTDVLDAWCSGNFSLQGVVGINGPWWTENAGADLSCCTYPEGYPPVEEPTKPAATDSFGNPVSPVGSGPTSPQGTPSGTQRKPNIPKQRR